MRKVKHRKPSRIKVSTSLTVAGAAVVATLMQAPANAVPNDPDAVPTAPAQPGESPVETEAPEAQPETGATPKPEETKPEQAPAQPGVTDPKQNKPDATAPQGEQPVQPGTTQPGTQTPKPGPSQPGVTTPRVAPLPVPGAQPVVVSPRQPGTTTPGQTQPGQTQPGQTVPGETKPETPVGTTPEDAETTPVDTLTAPETVQPRWEAPIVETAPAAPVVEMSGPHTEIGANIDGGGLLPGFAANTHHFSNLDGYVGTIGYSTPGGYGDAGVSLEFIEANTIKVTGFIGGGGNGEDRKVEFTVDTTQVNAAKAAAEGWIRLQPGGAALLEALGGIGRLPVGDMPAQRTDVGGVTTEFGGSVQY